ncbi:MAG: metallophosphoesterase, partial [Oscillospiraceae bacterium]|nr:metallophosphoesterase [Oscillospiraceae bacterium]
LMEFVEIVSAYDADIKFNDLYELYYNAHKLNVTTVSGSSDVTLTKGQPVVLWNYRTDVTATLPTEAEFREDLRIPDNALVLKIDNGIGWDSGATFALKLKATGATVCSFTTVNGETSNVLDGLAVELKVPMQGSAMEVYRNLTLPSAGYIYHTQVRGLVTGITTEGIENGGLYLTEIRPNDVSRKSTYGSSSDFMECFEVVNTTDKAIDLNKDYKIVYTVREGHRKVLEFAKYSSTASDHVGSSSGCTVPAGGTAVLWCYRLSNITDFTSFPTLTAFRNAYGISSSTPVYIFTNQGSLNNTNRAVEIFEADGSGLGKLVSSYTYIGASDVADDTSAQLQINPEGPEMILSAGNATSTMGTVDAAQLKYITDYGDAVEMYVKEGFTIPSSIMQGEDLRTAFWYAFPSRSGRTGTYTYYRFDGTGDWIQGTNGGIRTPNTYEVVITANECFDHDYVEFYVVNSNRFRDTIRGIYKVDIVGLNEVSGIRTNIFENEEVGGTISITANDGGTNSATKIYIDGVQQTTTQMMEDGAYFSFLADGVDSYFKNVITTTGNKEIKAIGKWAYVNLPQQLVHIDNSYFSYSSSKYKVTLRFWAGTFGTAVDEHLTPDANREDFKVSQLQLKLPNGKTYLPTSIGPSSYNGVDTSAKTNLSTAFDAIHAIGDSSKMCPYMDVTFNVPAADVNAVGVSVDTTKLSNGKHTLKVTNGTSTKTITFIVDNTAPTLDLGIEEGAMLYGNISFNPTIVEANGMRELTVLLDGQLIQTPCTITGRALGEGNHTLEATVTDMAGNSTTKKVTFEVNLVDMEINWAGNQNITGTSANFYLHAETYANTDVTFYKAERVDASNITATTVSGLVPYLQYSITVGDLKDTEDVVVNWNGTASGADGTHASNMFVRNIRTGAWDPIGTADAAGNIVDASFSAKDHVENGKATVIVQCTAGSSLPDTDTANDGKTGTNSDWNGTAAPKDYDFAFAWLSDTQGYVQRYNHHYMNMNQWIVDNREEWKISYVLHTGDIVDDWDAIYQWENADKAMKIFDEAGMPYGVLGGNHDVAAGLDDRENYYKYFGEDRVKNQPTFGGSYENNYGHYDLVEQNGQEFIIVYMTWNIYEDEINWMNQVLAEHSDRKAILCFHAYTHVKESVDGLLDYWGVMVRDHVVAKNPNVFAVLNGHYSGSTYQTVRFDDNGDGKKDRTVYQICTDYQSVEEGGLEYIKFLYFDVDNDKVFINSYSPYMDDFNYYDTGSADNLNALAKADSDGVVNKLDIDSVILEVDFSTAAQTITGNSFTATVYTDDAFGTASLRPSSGSGLAQNTFYGLTPHTDYSWYAVLENQNTGYLRTGVYDFTTKHNYVAVVTEPTCTAQGYTTHTCSACGDSYVDTYVEPLGHSFTDEVTPPTCTNNGYITRTCTVCGITDTTGGESATGHSYDSVVTAPDCTNRGYTTHTCSACGDSYVDSYVNPLGHSYTKVVTPPTCTDAGYTTYSCSACGDSYTADAVSATGHKYTSKVTAPTCTEAGHTTYTCSVCGDSYVGNQVSATGHSHVGKTVAPTCTAEGYTTYTCSACGDSYVADQVAALGHSYVNGYCSVCGEKDPDYVEVVVPTLTLSYPTLAFEAEILYNAYFTVSDASSIVEMGMITFSSRLVDGTIADAVEIIPGY